MVFPLRLAIMVRPDRLHLRNLLMWMLLAVISWPGPRPCIHSHERLACSETAFRSHLADFHSCQGTTAGDCNQPHCHWIFFQADAWESGVFPCGHADLIVSDDPPDRSLSAASVQQIAAEFLGKEPGNCSVLLQSLPNRKPAGYAGVSSQSLLCIWKC